MSNRGLENPESGLDPSKKLDYMNALESSLNKLRKMDDGASTETTANINTYIQRIEAALNLYERSFPNDPSLDHLKLVFEDLKKDFHAEKDLILDQGFQKIQDDMKEKIRNEGVRSYTLEEVPDNYRHVHQTMGSLLAAGHKIDGASLTQNPGARTVILVNQIHRASGAERSHNERSLSRTDAARENSRTADLVGAQREVGAIIDTMHTNGNLALVFAEGRGEREVYSNESFSDLSEEDIKYKGVIQAQLKHPEIIVTGLEDNGLLEDQLDSERRSENIALMSYRGSAYNVFLAANLAQTHELTNSQNNKVDVIVMGKGHENDSELPFSQTLAYFGVNVIIVDAAEQFIN